MSPLIKRVFWSITIVCSSMRAYAAEPDAHALCRSLGRGINLGNGLEAPGEGAWGYRIEEDHIPLIKKAGFDSIRIPIRWSVRAAKEPPYTIDPTFFSRVDSIVDQALKHDLKVVINTHHYDEVYRDPDNHLPRLSAMWKQISEHYRDRPSTVLFELLNEPNARLDHERWNKAVAELIPVVRATNRNRGVIVGPSNWNHVSHLEKLELPHDDRLLIATFHYYEPFQFTHQGASWAKGSDAWRGRKWGTPEELKRLRDDFDKAVAWAKKHDRPLYLGEFGAYSAAAMDARAHWTAAVVREAEARDISWAYWEFGSGFGVYDPRAKTWRDGLVKALLPTRSIAPHRGGSTEP
jgi:endoglucanase